MPLMLISTTILPVRTALDGASKDSSVTQIYILPNTEKGLVDWSERVSDEEYNNLDGK
jgi:hypothetical protein